MDNDNSDIDSDIGIGSAGNDATTSVTNTTTAAAGDTFAVPRSRPIKGRRKVRDFNECITCRLCSGYLIDATTLMECMHSFCRSCIIRHVQSSASCPTCSLSESPSKTKIVQLSHLRRDVHLQTIVFKLVADLRKSEFQRRQAYNNKQNSSAASLRGRQASHNDDVAGPRNRRLRRLLPKKSADGDNNNNNDDENDHQTVDDESVHDDGADDMSANEVFATDDPISLSLEYHPMAVAGYPAKDVPAIKYLQCPAAVTVQHLQRFLASKYSLNYERCTSSIDIQIIADSTGGYTDDDVAAVVNANEVLPATFTLMDVAYCTRWQRLAPMQLYYQILVSSPTAKTSSAVEVLPPMEKPLDVFTFNTETIKSSKDTNDNTILCGTTAVENVIDTIVNKHDTKHTMISTHTESSLPKTPKKSAAEKRTKRSIDRVTYIDDEDDKMDDDDVENVDDDDADDADYVDSDDDIEDDDRSEINVYSICRDKHTKPTKVKLVKSGSYSNRRLESNKTTTKFQKKMKPPPSRVPTSDFKSLRSNDVKYTAPQTAQIPTAVTTEEHKSSTNSSSLSTCKSPILFATLSSTIEEPLARLERLQDHDKPRQPLKRELTKTDSNINPRTNNVISGQSSASATPAQSLPTPSIVVSIPTPISNRRRNSLNEEQYEHMSLAKLKTASKKSSKTVPFKHNFSVDEQRKDLQNEIVPKLKIDLTGLYKKLSSSSSSANANTSTGGKQRETHKKRKKANKHSKEPTKKSSGNGSCSSDKRRKLHAEISQHIEEQSSLKFKLKITGSKTVSTGSVDSASKLERSNSIGISSGNCDSITPECSYSPSSPVDDSLDYVQPKSSNDIKPKMTPTISSTNDDADVIITNVSYPVRSTKTPETNNIGQLNGESSNCITTVTSFKALPTKPKPVPELRPKTFATNFTPTTVATAAGPIISPTKKYLPNMRFNTNANPVMTNLHARNQPPDIRPMSLSSTKTSDRVHGPAYLTPSAPSTAPSSTLETAETPKHMANYPVVSMTLSGNANGVMHVNRSQTLHTTPRLMPINGGSNGVPSTGSGSGATFTVTSGNKRPYVGQPTPTQSKKPCVPQLIPTSPLKYHPNPHPQPTQYYQQTMIGGRPALEIVRIAIEHDMNKSNNGPSRSNNNNNARLSNNSNNNNTTNTNNNNNNRTSNNKSTSSNPTAVSLIHATRIVQPAVPPVPGKFKPNSFASNVFHCISSLSKSSTASTNSSNSIRPTTISSAASQIALAKIRNQMRTNTTSMQTTSQQNNSGGPSGRNNVGVLDLSPGSSPTSQTQKTVQSNNYAPQNSNDKNLLVPSNATMAASVVRHSAPLALSSAHFERKHTMKPASRTAASLQTPIEYIDITSPNKSDHATTSSTSPAQPYYQQYDCTTNVGSSSCMETYVASNGVTKPVPLLNTVPKERRDDLSRRNIELRVFEQRVENLKLLSDSASARDRLEKNICTTILNRNMNPSPAITVSIAPIKPIFASLKPPATSVASLAAGRTSTLSTLRQQNASLRSIPNPSALALRGLITTTLSSSASIAAASSITDRLPMMRTLSPPPSPTKAIPSIAHNSNSTTDYIGGVPLIPPLIPHTNSNYVHNTSASTSTPTPTSSLPSPSLPATTLATTASVQKTLGCGGNAITSAPVPLFLTAAREATAVAQSTATITSSVASSSKPASADARATTEAATVKWPSSSSMSMPSKSGASPRSVTPPTTTAMETTSSTLTNRGTISNTRNAIDIEEGYDVDDDDDDVQLITTMTSNA